jgi:hypothetical protein
LAINEPVTPLEQIVFTSNQISGIITSYIGEISSTLKVIDFSVNHKYLIYLPS